MLDWLYRRWGSIEGRLIAGVAAMVAAANLARSGQYWPPQWEAATAFLAAFAAWLFAEFRSRASPYAHDIGLFKRIMDLIDDAERDFLRNHDFHVSFLRERLKGSREIRLWEGARYQFLDKAIQDKWGPLKKQFGDFGDLVAVSTSPDRNAEGHQTVHPMNHDPSDPNERVRAEIAALNRAASDLIESFDAFESFGRKRLDV